MPEPRALVKGLALDKKATYGLIGFKVFFLAHLMKRFKHGTIQFPIFKGLSLVRGEGNFRLGCSLHQGFVGGLDSLKVLHVKQIEAMAKIDHGPNYRWMLNPPALPGPLKSALVAVFPKIDSVAQPVVVVSARMQVCPARENVCHDRLIASVVSQHKAIPRHTGWRMLTIGFFELAGWCDDSHPLEESPCGRAVRIDLLGRLSDCFLIPECSGTGRLAVNDDRIHGGCRKISS